MNNDFTTDRYKIRKKGDNFIIYVNWYGTEILIPKDFNWELIWYDIEKKDDFIDNIIRWIDETDSSSNKELMKNDLKELFKDEWHEYILVSLNDNEIIYWDEDDYKNFNSIIEELITSDEVKKYNKNNKNYQYFIEAEKQ